MRLEDREILYYDWETAGLDEQRDAGHGLAVALNDGPVEYFPVWAIPPWVREKFADPNVVKVAFNSPFDDKFTIKAGYPINGPRYDVMLIFQLIDENAPGGLKPLSLRHIGPDALMNKSELDKAMHEAGVKNLGAFNKLDLLDPAHPYLPIIGKYSCEDITNTRTLFWKGVKRLRELHKILTERFGFTETPLTNYLKDMAPVAPVLVDMELGGIRVDIERMEQVRKESEVERDRLLGLLNARCQDLTPAIEEALTDRAITKHIAKLKSEKGVLKARGDRQRFHVKFNWESNQHVGKLFFEGGFNIPEKLVETTKTGYSLDETYLKNLALQLPPLHPIVPVLNLFAKYKKTLKIIGTYTGTDKKGIASKIRPNAEGVPLLYGLFPQTTDSGRLAPKRPNLANLPRNSPIKSFFIPRTPDHVFVYADWSQLQLRIAAHRSQDPVMMEAYLLDQDLHKRSASKMFRVPESEIGKDDVRRQSGKTANFAVIFGAKGYRLLEEFKEKNGLDYTLEECDAFANAIMEDWEGYQKYLDKELTFATRNKFVISETGRVRRLPDIVFGQYLNWKNKEFTGPKELRAKLLVQGESRLSDEDAFKRAKGKYRHAKNQAFCVPIQGLESSIMKRSAVRLHSAGYIIRNIIHDAFIVEVHRSELEKALKEVPEIMTTTYKLSVPLKAETKILRSFDEKDSISLEEALGGQKKFNVA